MAMRYVEGKGYVQEDVKPNRKAETESYGGEKLKLWDFFARFKGAAMVLLWLFFIASAVEWAKLMGGDKVAQAFFGLKMIMSFFVAVWFYKNCIEQKK